MRRLKLRYKVRDSIPGICHSCRNSTVIRHYNGNVFIRCHSLEKVIVDPVEECTSFDDATTPSQYDMEQIATFIITNKTGSIGFIKPGTEEHKNLSR